MIDGSMTILQNPPVEPCYTEVPRNVSIEITGRCNLRCRHCFNESGPQSSNELPLDRIEALLDEVRSWNVHSIRLSGGEPTVHRQFPEIVEACRRRGIGIGVNTNGIYRSKMLEFLKLAPIDVLFISLDGVQSNNDAIRGEGTFLRAVESCRQLHAAGHKVIISFHVGEGNRGDIPELAELAAELGVDLKVAPMRPVGRALRELPDFLINPRNFYAVARTITELRRRHSHIRLYTDFDLLDGPGTSKCSVDTNRSSCKAGRSMVNVRSDGAINPCAFFDHMGNEFCAGNIYHDSPKEVWQRPSTFKAFRVHQKSDECQSCQYFQKRCSAGCPAISYSITGKLDSLDPTCFASEIEPQVLSELEDPVEPLPFANFVTPPEEVDL